MLLNKITPIGFNLTRLCDFRMQIADILDLGIVEHTPKTLAIMRAVYGSDDVISQAKVDFIESKLGNSGRNRPRLHSEILASVLAFVRMSKAKSVLDIGCGEGLLIRALAQEESIERVAGIETDPKQIKVARALFNTITSREDIKINLYKKDVTMKNLDILMDYDVVTVVEVVEHIQDRDWINHIFYLNPPLLIVTTPNREFNVLYDQNNLNVDGLRDPDHKFEFTRNEFITWAKKHGDVHGYSVNPLPVGPADIEHGSSGQMAVFQKK